MTAQQLATLAWLASPSEEHFRVDQRVWNALKERGYVVHRGGYLRVTAAGRTALRAAQKGNTP